MTNVDMSFDPYNYAPHYRPIHGFSLAMDYFFWGRNPMGFHITNLLLHIGVSVLSFFMFVRLIGSCKAGLYGALIFAVHPVHGEAVAYVAARVHLLATFFVVLSFFYYLKGSDEKNRKHLISSVFFFGLSLLSSEMAIMMVAVLPVFEFSMGRGLKDTFKKVAPYVFMVVIFLIIRFLILENTEWSNPDRFFDRFITSFNLIFLYLKNLIYPFSLKVFYPRSYQEYSIGLSIFVFIALLSALLFFWKRNKLLFFSMGWFLLTLFPVLGILAGIYPAVMADRYLYMPSVGFCLFAGVVLKDVLKNRFIFLLIMPLITGMFFYVTFKRTGFYKDNLTLWERAHRFDAPLSAYVIDKLANELALQGKYAESEEMLKKIFTILPGNVHVHVKLAQIYLDQNKHAEAENILKKGLSLNDEFMPLHEMMGAVYFSTGRVEEAEKTFNFVLEKKTKNHIVYNNLGVIYMFSGNPRKAIEMFTIANKIKPGVNLYQRNLSDAKALLQASKENGQNNKLR